MPDIVSPEVRSRMMAGIGPADTKPEMQLRRGLHALGWRYRLHDRRLPGRPDLVFHRRNAVIFVNGCFWHGHDCHLFKWPKSREEFWHTKICGNIRRDRKSRHALLDEGWRVLDVWECTLKGRERWDFTELLQQCAHFLGGSERQSSIGRAQWVPTDALDDACNSESDRPGPAAAEIGLGNRKVSEVTG